MNGWIRVSKSAPCPICKKPDWCGVREQIACCMRISSDKPSNNGGWFHLIGSAHYRYLKPIPPESEPKIDAGAIMQEFSAETRLEMVAGLAGSLGVSLNALDDLGVAWATGHRAWAFPMKDWMGNTIGIRLRDDTGRKWAVRGSKAGLFYTEGESKRVFVTEGPTDTAAGLSIGLCCVGRPSCLGCEEETNKLLRRKRAREVVIVSDNDEPGYRGAVKLQSAMSIPSVIWVPPSNDLREMVRSGASQRIIDSLTGSLVWTQPHRTDSTDTRNNRD